MWFVEGTLVKMPVICVTVGPGRALALWSLGNTHLEIRWPFLVLVQPDYIIFNVQL